MLEYPQVGMERPRTADKCEGCPYTRTSKATDLGIGPWCLYFGEACVLVTDCHLTDRDKTIIEAMIRGVFNCGHCAKFRTCASTRNEVPPSIKAVMQNWWPCEEWLERNDHE